MRPAETVPAELWHMEHDRAEIYKEQLAFVTNRLLAQRKRLRELERLQAGRPPLTVSREGP